jgi:hypothetical protein
MHYYEWTETTGVITKIKLTILWRKKLTFLPVTEAATAVICVWVRLLTVLWHWPYFGIKQLIMLNLKKIRSINISTLMQYAKVYCKHSKLQLQPTTWKTFRKYLQHRLVCALHLFTWLLAAIDMKITHGLHYVSHSFPYDRKCNLWHKIKV